MNDKTHQSAEGALFRVIVIAKQKHLPALSAGTNIRKVPAENAEILALNSIITKARKLNLRFMAAPYGKIIINDITLPRVPWHSFPRDRGSKAKALTRVFRGNKIPVKFPQEPNPIPAS